MKKNLLFVFLLAPVLILSQAYAAPYTSTLNFDGTAWYQSEVEQPPYGEAYINYEMDENLPDLDEVCDWTLGVEFWTSGEMISGENTIDLGGHFVGGLPLGTWSFNEVLDRYSYVIDFLNSLPSEGWVPGLENFVSYSLEGDRLAGTLELALWVPIIQNIDDLKVEFSGIVTLTANPVPEPATMFLMGFGLIGLAGFGRKKFANN